MAAESSAASGNRHTISMLFHQLAILFYPVVLVGLLLQNRSASARGKAGVVLQYSVLALLAGAVAAFNLTFYILPYSRVAANPPLEFALKMNPVWNQGTMVYYGTFITDDWTIRYFNPKTSWRPLDPRSLGDVERELPSRNVWLDTTALDLLSSRPEGREWLSAHVAADQRYELVSTGHRIIFQKIVPDSSGALH